MSDQLETLADELRKQIYYAMRIDPEFLLEVKSSSADEFRAKAEEVKMVLESYLRSTEGLGILNTSKIFCWHVEGYELTYRKQSPVVVLWGTDLGIRHQTRSKRFSSSRKARIWARSQIGAVMTDITWFPTEPFTMISLDITVDPPGDPYMLGSPPILRDQAAVKLSSL